MLSTKIPFIVVCQYIVLTYAIQNTIFVIVLKTHFSNAALISPFKSTEIVILFSFTSTFLRKIAS